MRFCRTSTGLYAASLFFILSLASCPISLAHGTHGLLEHTLVFGPGDSCSTAIEITSAETFNESRVFDDFTGSIAGTNLGCVVNQIGQGERWYKFTAQRSNSFLSIRREGSGNLDGVIEVFDGCNTPAIVCQDETTSNNEVLILPTDMEQQYYYRVYHNGSQALNNTAFSTAVAHIPYTRLREQDQGLVVTPASIIRSNWPSNTFNLTHWQFQFIEIDGPTPYNPDVEIPGLELVNIVSIVVITSPNGHNPQFRMHWFPEMQSSRTYLVRTRPMMYQGPTWGDWEPYSVFTGAWPYVNAHHIDYWPLEEMEEDGSGVGALTSPHALSNLYPNPAAGEVSIQFVPGLADTRADIAIFDLSGREVYRTVYGVNGGTTQRFIYDASALANGTYLVKIKTDTTENTEKLIVRR